MTNSFENFCGGEFWLNSSYTPYKLPNFTECFQHTILIWIPALFFWLMVPIFLLQVSRVRIKKYDPLPWSLIFFIKTGITLTLFIDALFFFIKYFIDNSNGANLHGAYIVFPFIWILTMLCILLFQFLCKFFGLVTSGIIHITFILFAVCGAPELYDFAQHLAERNNIDYARCYAYFLWYICLLSQIIVQCFADPRVKSKIEQNLGKKSTELDSSFINRITLWWYTPIPLLGAKKDLEVKDLYELNEGNRSSHLVPLWEKYWNPTIEKYNTTKKNLIKEIKSYEKKSGTNPHQLEKLKKQLYRLKTPSIIGNLFKMFKFELITVTAIKALSDTIQFANPFILHELIAFISKPHGDLWIGVAYAAGMFIASELRSILHNYHNYLMFRMGVKIQSVLMTAVYKKNLKLSNIARKEKTLGEIVNLMAIDVERFQTITPEIPLYLSIPYQCTLALVFLLTIMGYSALPGVLIMLFAIPLNIFCSKWTRGWNMKQMKLKDERVKMCNEILSGIRVIKFYAWEIPMKEIIERIRKQELVCILKTALVKYSVDVFNWSSPFLVGFFSFLTYTLSDPEHHILTPQVAFVSLTLFNMLRQPMTQTGMLITQTVQVIVSNRRLKDFLVADEHDLDSIKRSYDLNETSTTIEVKNGDFSWEAQEDKVDNKFGNLHDINLEVPSKNLIAVVGKVGCGKSSLLSSLLGEMQKIKGYVSVQGRLAYVPQQAWIQNLPLRDNILFGKPFNKEIYDSVVDACALRPDIAILPQGDMTEIGEKGINLSGGQKARVSLARAVYQNYDVYLLDDPLSAVDSHVGKHIFEKVIGPEGLLRNKTRILVTHGISFLKYMDTIIHIENGRIIDVGTYDELISHKEKFAKLIEEAKTEKQQTGSSTDTNSTNDDPIDRSLSSQKEDADSAISEEDLNKKENSNRRISTISIIEQRKNGYSGKRLDDILIQESKEPPRLKTNQKLIQKEKVETGRVKMNVYKQYAESATYVRSFIFILMYVIYGGVQMLRNFWLSSWEDDEAEHRNDHKMRNLGERLGVYAVYGLGESLALTLSLLALILGTLQASKNLHSPLLYNILRAPMSFFDTTPIGRILNRFGRVSIRLMHKFCNNFLEYTFI